MCMRIFLGFIAITLSFAVAQDAPKPPGPAQQTSPVPGAFRIGGSVSAPVATVKPGPEYDASARERGVQGEVLIAMVVDQDGLPQNLHVIKSLDSGLDQKALEAVAKWRFKPGMKDGQPVPVQATLAVTFRLADRPPDTQR